MTRPRNRAQQHRAEVRLFKSEIKMTGDAHHGAVGFRPALGGFFVSPHHRLHVEDLHLVAAALPAAPVWRVARGQHVHVGRDVHVVVNLVVDAEIRRAPRDGMPAADFLVLGVIEIHHSLFELRLSWHPRAADDALPPRRIIAHRRSVNDHQPAAPLRELGDIGLLLLSSVAALLRIHHENVGLLELLGGRPVHRAVGFHTAIRKQHLPIVQKFFVLMRIRPVRFFSTTDEHPERLRSDCGKRKADEENELKAAFHGNFQKLGI